MNKSEPHDTEIAYGGGYDAYLNNMFSRQDNPYEQGTVEYMQWDNGWQDAQNADVISSQGSRKVE